jgi:chaperonin cofactor prefoldin
MTEREEELEDRVSRLEAQIKELEYRLERMDDRMRDEIGDLYRDIRMIERGD